MISDKKAELCYNCGAPVKNDFKIGRFGALVLIIIFGVFISLFKTKDEPEVTPQGKVAQEIRKKDSPDTSGAVAAAHKFVKRSLKAPSTAKSPGIFADEREQVKYLGKQKFKVTSWVDSQNSFGAMIRTRYVIEVEKQDSDTWKLISLEILK